VPFRAATRQLQIRRLEPDDLDAAAELTAAAFGIDVDEQDARQRWLERLAHPVATDPDGAFVAERDGRIIGLSQALCRERLWCLSMLAVDPAVQSAGAGRALLESALGYDNGTDAGVIVSSNDARAMRLYGGAGFALLPTLRTEGALDRTTLPSADARVREAGVEHLEALASISREIRGAPHTAELKYALGRGGRLLRYADRGFVVVLPNWAVWLLVARDQQAAGALLWAAIEAVGDTERPLLSWLTADQQWAIEVAVRAGLRPIAHGALCVRGDPGPLAPFIPSAPFA
jgi:ribosomal protein S18 acetylase RimI-like enzyme